jgi:hypothetical protein
MPDVKNAETMGQLRRQQSQPDGIVPGACT